MNTLNQPENANTKVSDGWKSLTNHRGTPGKVLDGFRLLFRVIKNTLAPAASKEAGVPVETHY